MMRPTPETVGELAEICQYVTAPDVWLEMNARALRLRLEIHSGGIYWQDVPEEIFSNPLDTETQEAFEKIRAEWIMFRDAMKKVFGE